MKNFETEDLFKALRVVKSTGLKDDLQPVLRLAAEGKADVTKVGIEGIITVVGAFAEKGIEQQLYDLLSGPFEMEPTEIAHLDIVELCDKIEQLWTEGNLQVFCKRLSGLIGTKSLS